MPNLYKCRIVLFAGDRGELLVEPILNTLSILRSVNVERFFERSKSVSKIIRMKYVYLLDDSHFLVSHGLLPTVMFRELCWPIN